MHRFAESGVLLKPTPPGDIPAAVGAIYDLYETMGDLLIRRLADERRRPATKPQLDAGRANHRAWVDDIFAPLVKGRGRAVRAEMLDALTAATDVYVWQKLRRDMKLNRAAAEAVVRRMVLGATNRERNDGEDSLAQLVRRREPPPSLGVARSLQERGHVVSFAGRPEMVPRVKTAGFRAIEFTRAYEQVERYPQGSFYACPLPDLARRRGRSERGRRGGETGCRRDRRHVSRSARAIGAFQGTDSGVRPYFRSPPARNVAGHVRAPRRHAAAGGLRRPAGSRLAVGTARPHRVDESRRLRRAATAGVGKGAPRRPGAGGRALRRADALALAGKRSDAAHPRQLQHRLRAAQRREGAACARRARRSAGPRRRDDRRHRRAERSGDAAKRDRAELCRARSDHAARGAGHHP